MHNNFVLNHLSLPAADKDLAHTMLLNTMRGMLAYGEYGDSFSIYSDGKNKIFDFEISPGYKYEDFVFSLEDIGEEDLQLALLEISDKTPMLDFLNAEQFDAISESAFYFPDEAYSTTIDILGVAWELDAVLLSLNTSAKWSESEVRFAKYSTEPMLGFSYIDNISKKEHGISFNEERKSLTEKTFAESFPICKFSDAFLDWHSGLAELLKIRVKEKISLAVGKNFSGGKPLFDSLSDADGMREIRFSNIEGGAVRIIFKDTSDKKHAILCGFIKKSNAEGYDQAIIDARKILKGMAS